MTRYGIGQVDLNARAQLALFGLSKTPEKDIADLLESKQPIEDATRALLAMALTGKRVLARLQVTKSRNSNAISKFKLRLKRLHVGREALQQIAKAGRAAAIEAVAETLDVDFKSVESSVTLANYIAKRISELRRANPQASEFSDRELEIALLYADAFGAREEDQISPALPLLARLADAIESSLAAASGLHRPWHRRS